VECILIIEVRPFWVDRGICNLDLIRFILPVLIPMIFQRCPAATGQVELESPIRITYHLPIRLEETCFRNLYNFGMTF
jgi:hypothetical protein